MKHLLRLLTVLACIISVAHAQSTSAELLKEAFATDDEGVTSFCNAAYKGDLAKVKQYLDAGADPNRMDKKQRYPLRSAINGNHPEIVYLLLEKGADIHAQDSNGATLLYWVAGSGNRPLLDELLKRGAKITKEGWHPLLGATAGGKTEMMEFFLKAGIPIDAYDNGGWNALHIAASHKNQSAIEWLLKHGANINSTNENGWTPLMRILQEDTDFQLVEFFIKNGADIHASTVDSWSCLHMALRYTSKPEVIELLLKKGASLAPTDEGRRYPLARAIHNKSSEAGNVVRLLIKHGIDPNASLNGSSALFLAARDAKNPDVIKALLDAGAKVTNNESIEYVAVQNSEDAALILLDSGMDISLKNNMFAYTIEIKEREKLLQTLLQQGVNVNQQYNEGDSALIVAIRGNTEYVPLLLNAGADVNLANKEGTTPLITAVESGNKELVALLLQTKAEVNQADNKGKTPLMAAVEQGNEDIVSFLLTSGADVKAKDNEGAHALFYLKIKQPSEEDASSDHQSDGIIDQLIRAGLSVNDKNNDGVTLLMVAASQFNEPLMDVALAHGANLNDRDTKGNTPVMHLYLGYLDQLNTQYQNVIMAAILSGGNIWNMSEFTEEENEIIQQIVQKLSKEIHDRLQTLSTKLQEAGAKLNTQNKEGITPLMIAASKCPEPQWIQSLLDAGADINASDKEGKAALIYAAINTNPAITSTLIAAYADTEHKDQEGKSALDYAREAKNSRVVTELIKARSIK